jgi:hypothetical protein
MHTRQQDLNAYMSASMEKLVLASSEYSRYVHIPFACVYVCMYNIHTHTYIYTYCIAIQKNSQRMRVLCAARRQVRSAQTCNLQTSNVCSCRNITLLLRYLHRASE